MELERILMRDEISHLMLGACIQGKREVPVDYIFDICRSVRPAHKNVLHQKLSRLEDEGALRIVKKGLFQTSDVSVADWHQAALSRLVLRWSRDYNLPTKSYATTQNEEGSINRIGILNLLYDKPRTGQELLRLLNLRNDTHWNHLRELIEGGLVTKPRRSLHEGNTYSFQTTPEQYFLTHLHPILQKTFILRDILLEQGLRGDEFMKSHRGGASYKSLNKLLSCDILRRQDEILHLNSKYSGDSASLIADLVLIGCNQLNMGLRDMARLYSKGHFQDKDEFSVMDMKAAGASSRYLSIYLKREAEASRISLALDSIDKSNWAYGLTAAGTGLVSDVIRPAMDLLRGDIDVSQSMEMIPHVLVMPQTKRNNFPKERYRILSPECFGFLMVAFNYKLWDRPLIRDLAIDRSLINGYELPTTLQYTDCTERTGNVLVNLGLLDRNDNLTRQAYRLARYFAM